MVNKIAKQCCLFLLCWPLQALPADSTLYQVDKVFDGDTILLNDGRKVRLLGINTPEVGGYKSAEAGGAQAKRWLIQQLEHKNVSLQQDVELQDKYGRSLAYIFTEDQRHINLELVAKGLASVSIFPPNLQYTEALLAAEQTAEQAGLGIWSYPEYAPLPFQNLTADNHLGWKRITGTIQAVKHGANSSYLQFSEQVAIQIDNQYAALFPALDAYIGKQIEARGWVHQTKNRFSLPVRHPGSIKVLAFSDFSVK